MLQGISTEVKDIDKNEGFCSTINLRFEDPSASKDLNFPSYLISDRSADLGGKYSVSDLQRFAGDFWEDNPILQSIRTYHNDHFFGVIYQVKKEIGLKACIKIQDRFFSELQEKIDTFNFQDA